MWYIMLIKHSCMFNQHNSAARSFSMYYPNLLSPGKIGSLTVKNRVIMPAMGDALANMNGEINDDFIAYYQERAKGGTGLIITGVCRVDPDGPAVANQFAVYNLSHVSGLKRLADAVHRYDGRVFIQLHHAGRQTNTMITGKEAIAPSAIAVPGGLFATPRAMTIEEIKAMVGKFVFAAVLAKMGGIDGVEIHCAHGYLLNQFLSGFSNKRTDEYGGSLENRMRIVKEILAGIKAQCGPSFPVSVRISANEFVEGGITVEEAVEIAKKLEEYGADMVNVSGGGYHAMYGIIAPASFDQGWMVPFAAAVKQAVKIPVAAVSLIRDFDYADSIIADGKCDFVCFGRPHIADPYFVNKLTSGREKEIRRCICCLYCSDELNSSRLGCSINPVVGHEKEFSKYEKDGNGRIVAVIGGGPSGCEAARVLAIRGFKVTLFEKSDKLGGQIKLGSVPPHKFRINWLIEYYEYILKEVDVDVKLNTEVTATTIEEMKPYAIFLATGSEPIIPHIKGIDGPNVCTVDSVLAGEKKFEGKKVLVVGSGNTGLETAEYLLQFRNEVTIAEMLPKIGMLAPSSGNYTLGALTQAGAKILLSHMLKSIDGTKVEFLNLASNETVIKEFDAVVLSVGVRPVNGLAEQLAGKSEKLVLVGDSYQVGNIATSVKSGFQKAFLFDSYKETV
ncbi:MAG: NAD(P)/FAD-dependent oxidoreductase [Spirochaetaceae bacterium]|nr:NAD(P)/FAD-dependent oxidoreductase [Spirochaetaceae bacterium]